MRLPFGLGRRSSSGDGAASDDSSAGFDTGFADTGIAVAVPASSRAWASLPPIQRTSGDMPLVAAPGSFAEALPGSQGLPPIVQPLGHEVSNLATPGLVVARTRPVEAPSTGSIPAPVQRRATRPAEHAPVHTAAAPAYAAPVPDASMIVTQAPVPSASPEAPSTVVTSTAPAAPAAPALPVAPPIRSMPTVSRQAIHIPDRPLTTAASAARPAAVQRAAAAAEAAAAGVAPLSMPVSGGMRRVPSGTSPSMPVVSRQAAPTQPALATPTALAPAASTTTAAVPVAQRSPASTPTEPSASGRTTPSMTEPPRLGLGAPLAAVPASARPVGAAPPPGPVVSRSTTSGPMPVAASNLLPTGQRSTSSEALASAAAAAALPIAGRGAGRRGGMAGTEPVAGAAPATAAIQRLAALPHLPVARPAASHSAPAAAGGSASTSAGTAPATSSSVSGSPIATPSAASVQTSVAPEIRPIAADNPIRPSFVLQRSPSDDESDDDAGGDAALPSPWWAPASESHATAGSFFGAGFDGGSAAVQRTTSSDSARAASPATFGSRATVFGSRATAMSSASGGVPAAATLQRSSGPATRPLPPARGAVPDFATRSTQASSAALATASATGSPTPMTVPGVTSGPVVQMSRDGVRPEAPGASFAAAAPTVQRENTRGTQRGGPAGTSGGRGHSERELEELAQALFSRIRGRLRNELIHDREAKGLTFDNV